MYMYESIYKPYTDVKHIKLCIFYINKRIKIKVCFCILYLYTIFGQIKHHSLAHHHHIHSFIHVHTKHATMLLYLILN